MKTLLLFISLIFSLCFYKFYTFSQTNNIFLESLSGNLLIEVILFFVVGILFYFYFSNKEKLHYGTLSKKSVFTLKNFFFLGMVLFYSFLFYYLFFIQLGDNFFALVIVLLFFISEISFYLLSNIVYFKKEKYNLRYLGLIINYSFSIFSVLYLLNNDFQIVIFGVLFYSIFFHIFVFIKYKNIVSLLFSLFIGLFFTYYLFLNLNRLYLLS